MNQLDAETRVRIVSALIEGVGINATCPMVGVSKNTVLKLLAQLGTVCEDFHDTNVVNLQSKRIQCDEIWAFCHCKEKNKPAHLEGVQGIGDVWTWTCIDADSKLMIDWEVGGRDSDAAHSFMRGVAARLANRVQITTDGFRCYKSAIAYAFDGDRRSDYGICVKTYDDDGEGKYSPGKCTGVELKPVWGKPDLNKCSTSFVERQNLSIRMSNRRFTRLTNGHSKKVANHCHALALNFVHHNFCRKHMSLEMKTPAMVAGLANHVWTLAELVGLLDSK